MRPPLSPLLFMVVLGCQTDTPPSSLSANEIIASGSRRSEQPHVEAQLSALIADPLTELACHGDANQDGRIDLRDYYTFRENLGSGDFDIVAFARWRQFIIHPEEVCISKITNLPVGAILVEGTRLNSPLIEWELPANASVYQAELVSDRCDEVAMTYRGNRYTLTPPLEGERCNHLDDDCDGQVDEGVSAQCSPLGLQIYGSLNWGGGSQGQMTSLSSVMLTSSSYVLMTAE